MASSRAKQTTVFSSNQKNVLTSQKQIDFILHLVVKPKKFPKKNNSGVHGSQFVL